MVPLNLDGTKWSSKDANMVLQAIAGDVRGEFHERDTLRGVGGIRSIVRRDPRRGWVVDESKSRLLHAGSEYTEEIKRRWVDYCESGPKDVKGELAKIGQTPEAPTAVVTRIVGGGMDAAGLNEAIATAVRTTIETMMNAKGGSTNGRGDAPSQSSSGGRRRGRPRKPPVGEGGEGQSQLGAVQTGTADG